MASNSSNDYNQSENNSLSQDHQYSSWEMMLPSAHMHTGEEEQQLQVGKRKKKCHGNRKLQHFKRKWRTRGLNEEEITTLIQNRNHTISEQSLNDQTIIEQTHESNKRKRDLSTQPFIISSIKSMSQLSISQGASKKLKCSLEEETNSFKSDRLSQSNRDNIMLYKPSKYLKMPRKLLLHSLRLHFNYSLKKKREQNFILLRLKIIDPQFCVDEIRSLYQTYVDLGLQYQIWPDDILKIVPSNEPNVIQKYLEDYLIILRDKIDQYTTELMTQSTSFPSTLPHLEIIDSKLQEFVRLHHLDLSRTIYYQIGKLNTNINIKKFSNQLSLFHLTTKQNEIINEIISIRKKQLKIFENMTMFEQQILCHKLPNSFNNITLRYDEESHANVRNKTMQDFKRRMLKIKLGQYEAEVQYYESLYEKELTIFETEIHKNNSSYQISHVNELMHYLKTYLYHHTKLLLSHIRYKESRCHVKLLQKQRRRHRHRSPLSNKAIGVYPQIIVDVPNVSLNSNQLDYLSRTGPNYIRPNQSYLYSSERRQKQMQREHKNIMNTITSNLVYTYHMPHTSNIIKQFSQQLTTCLQEQYTVPISYLDIRRTRKEWKLMKSIQFRLKKEKYILRVTDKSSIFHLGNAIDYERKAQAYQEKTGAYIELESDPLWVVFDKVVHLLNGLRSKKHILASQYTQMMPKRDKIALAYLYFVPKPHKEGTPLRPIISSINSPTTGISKFLDKLIRPLFDKHVRSTTIIDGVDLIHRLETYTENGYLKPTTQLCTFDITDLYTMLPQEESLDVLTEFLLEYNYHKMKSVPLDAIRKLARLVLTENVFIYEKKFYRQVIGGAMGSAFTLTLANIFMWKWEKVLVQRQLAGNEIYGRYIDDIFFTSNESSETINQMLNEANNLHSNIKLVRQIGTSVSFLDIFIENKNGVLVTSVYHKEAAEPYIVPFTSDHPRHVFAGIIDGALTRAVRYSSTLSAFNEERRSIKLMLLYNGYPPRYIHSRFMKFFISHIPTTTLLPIIRKDYLFTMIRNFLLNKPTAAAYGVASRIGNATAAHDTDIVEDPLVRLQLNKKTKWSDNIIIHYTHEARLNSYKKAIHQLWNQIFSETPVMNTKLIVGNRNNANNKLRLAHRRPHQDRQK